ncbi:MAG: flagellar hook-length control protein FliK [Gammaproteobacteria bacterium]
MEKAIQAIDIAKTTTVSNGKPRGKADANGEATPFSEVLSPAREQAARPAEGQTGDTSGKPLPGEQTLPEGGTPHAASAESETASPLLNRAEVEQVTELIDIEPVEPVTLSGEAIETAATVVETAPPAALTAVQGDVAEAPVVSGTNTRPTGEHNAGAVPGTDVRQPQVAAADVPSTGREPARTTANRGDAGIAVHTQPTPPTPPATNGSTATAAEAAQASVRAGVQQALAAQVAQDGLQQSLSGNRQTARHVNGIATANPAVEHAAASFMPLLNEIAGITSPARISIPVGEAGWGRAVGEQVVWHVSQNIQAANLRLNPQHLGPLEMQVQMEGDKATLAFTSQHAAVRDALESSLPRLREMFAQNGLDLVDVNVSQDNGSGRDAHQATAGRSAVTASEVDADNEHAVLPASVPGAAGMVDCYV